MRTRRTECGASAVEAAIAVPLVFFLIFLVFQSALFMRSYLSVRDAATDGARAGSIAANASGADYDIVHAVDQSLSASTRSSLERVVVYKATDASTGVPSDCEFHAVLGKCNFYTAADLGRRKRTSDLEIGPETTAGRLLHAAHLPDLMPI